MIARVGDRLVLETERVGEIERSGQVLEVLDPRGEVHYRVRWSDGHESYYFPAAGGYRVVRAGRGVEVAAG